MAGDPVYDLLIIGGGINGCGIARDAAGRGLSVLVCEQSDLASATSSASSKLIHGGLRYLEHYEFRLVSEALAEREVLLRLAPHIIWPLRFVLPHHGDLRPAWFLRLGLFLYDHIGGRRSLPGTKTLDLRRDPEGEPLSPELVKGFAYSDCWVDDARLVVLNALDARERGAAVRTRTKCVEARREGGVWHARLRDVDTGAESTVRARILVNAAGPWVAEVLRDVVDRRGPAAVRLVKGSHIVVPRLHDGSQAYILQNRDGRIVFVIPYEDRFSLIGTTDVPYHDDPAAVRISEDEIAYLCDVATTYFRKPVRPADVVHSYAGVRPLYDDAAANPSAITRDYVFDVEGGEGVPPLLTIYGGKITTYRKLAEHALRKLQPFLQGLDPAWTAREPLPGGDMPGADFERFATDFAARHPWLPAEVARRYARRYGTRAERIVAGAGSVADLGTDFGAGLFEREVAYLIGQEWARTAEDILWRRTKRGLHMSPSEIERFEAWFADDRVSSRSVASADEASGCSPRLQKKNWN